MTENSGFKCRDGLLASAPPGSPTMPEDRGKPQYPTVSRTIPYYPGPSRVKCRLTDGLNSYVWERPAALLHSHRSVARAER